MAKVGSKIMDLPRNKEENTQGFSTHHSSLTTSPQNSNVTQTPINHLEATTPNNHLVASPYTELSHLLDLSALDTPNKLMALALQKMEPTTPSYATNSYPTSFNWPIITTTLSTLCNQHSYTYPPTTFYIVIFTSTVLPTCNYEHLSLLDKLSHAEAMASGGFLKYWFGSPDQVTRKNLATCIWRSKEDARRGTKGECHRRAVMAARESYEGFGIEVLRLNVGEGVGSWVFEKWVD